MEHKQNLLDQENMKSFLQLLEENGMHDEKLSVQLLAGYVDQMEFQFNTVLEELKSVRQELNTIQDKTLRATASRAVDKVVTKVEEAKGQLMKLKNHIVKTVDKAITEFKEHGKSALVTAMKSLNVKGLLENIKSGLNYAAQSADYGIDKLTKLGNEVHAVNSHLKNAGRVLVGKEIKDLEPRDTDKGILSKIQESLFFSMSVFSHMSQKTDDVINTVKKLEDKSNSKKSVKSELQDIKNKQQHNKSNDKSRKDIELGQR